MAATAVTPERITEFLNGAAVADLAVTKWGGESDVDLASRLLRARKGDVPKALALLNEIATWRREKLPPLRGQLAYSLLNGVTIDEIGGLHPKCYFPTPDRFGRPIYVERTGALDVDTLGTLFPRPDFDAQERHHIYTYESDLRYLLNISSRAKGECVNNIVSILDLAGMSMSLAGSSKARAFVKHMAALDSAVYPELLGKMLIINAPGIFSAAWAVIKGFLDEHTVSKIAILGGPSSYMPELLKLVDKAHIPTEYGGDYVVPGGLFPPSRTKTDTAGAGKALEVETPARAGEVWRFKWLAQPSDVKFALLFKPASGGAPITVEEAKEYKKCDSNWVVLQAAAPTDGAFVAVWDNKGGWRQREVIHREDRMVAPPAGAPAVSPGGVALGTLWPETALTRRSIVVPAPTGAYAAAAWAALAAAGFPDAAELVGVAAPAGATAAAAAAAAAVVAPVAAVGGAGAGAAPVGGAGSA